MSNTIMLHELGAARDILDEWIEEAVGELTPEIDQLLQELAGSLNTKIENVALYIREQLVTAIAIENEVERLQSRAKARRAAADRLKLYLQSWMERTNTTNVKGDRCSVALQLNPPAVKGDLDEGTLRGLFMVEPTLVRYAPESFALDRRAVLDAHKLGKPIPDGLTVERSQSVRIR